MCAIIYDTYHEAVTSRPSFKNLNFLEEHFWHKKCEPSLDLCLHQVGVLPFNNRIDKSQNLDSTFTLTRFGADRCT